SQEKFNVTSYDAMAFGIITVQAFAGLWINGFIVCVLCVAWVKKKIFNSNEKILLVLGCSRLGDLCTTWVYFFLSIIYPQCFYVNPIPQMLSSIRTFLLFSNLWVSACLCVFYCIKIANFQHTFFIYLKVKIDRMVPWLLLVSELFQLIIGIFAYDITYRAIFQNVNSTAPTHFWDIPIKMDGQTLAFFCISGFVSTTAFLTAIFSVFLLLFSLWRHKRKMQANSVRNLSMDAHTKAIKSILSFIFIYSINFTGYILSLIQAKKTGYVLMFLILIFQYVPPIVHSLILIFINPKLGKIFLRTLSCLK
ncbi:TA2R8 protein, partial [Ramphastos sulfuratus]|nr:TA2R8 protein [Ramphastos sulfuratus]